MKKQIAKPINKSKMYAYFSPDGYVQVRSIAETKSMCREAISYKQPNHSWKDYESNGFFLKQITVEVLIP